VNTPLTYKPAYFGLFAALTLAITCNVFLDISYGSFGTEVLCWSVVFALTLFVGAAQSQSAGTVGIKIQRVVLIAGALAAVFVFLPKWGIPRAGIYILAMLQAANNCVTTTRRHLHLGLLVSAAMVSFAATHSRADWTMLFYLVPYVCATVFTLVAEQINQRALEARQAGIGTIRSRGQGVAVAAASTAILIFTALLYWTTPQITWPYLHWRFGQGASFVTLDSADEAGGQKEKRDGESIGDNKVSRRNDAPGNDPKPSKNSDQDTITFPTEGVARGSFKGTANSGTVSPGAAGDATEPLGAGTGSPTAAEMRAAADRPGMPSWQAGVIRALATMRERAAEMAETLKALSKKASQTLDGTVDAFKAVCKELGIEFSSGAPQPKTPFKKTIFNWLLWLLLIVAAILLYRSKARLWARTRYDYVHLGLLAPTKAHKPFATREYYSAMERLMRLHRMPRPVEMNTFEYQREITHRHGSIRDEVASLTAMFEQQRYGGEGSGSLDRHAMRQAYRELFRKLKYIKYN